MKKIYLTLLSVFTLGSVGFSQTSTEAFRLANTQNLGTARYNGLSGAFGALGGDLTAISENPAGSAVFTNSYGSITLSSTGRTLDNQYRNTITNSSDANLSFNQIGGVLVLKNSQATNGIKTISLGLTYNKEADHNNEITYSATNISNSIANFFVGQANGINSNQLIRNGRFDDEALIDLSSGPSGLQDNQAYFGFQNLLTFTENENSTEYFSNVTSVDFQDLLINTRGNSGKITLNLGINTNDKLYVGANLNLHTVNRRKDISFVELNNFGAFDYEISQRTSGGGASLGVGAIYKATPNLRLGVSYQTPTWLTLTEEVDQFTTIEFSTPQNINGESFSELIIDPQITIEFNEYQLRTPGEISASFAYVFGKKGLFSAQYSRKDFSNIEYDTGDLSTARQLNTAIENTLQAVNTFKAGAEIRNQNWSYRGGANYATSPYQDSRFGGEAFGYSLGLGYNWGKWLFDISYSYLRTEINEVTFENNLFGEQNTATSDQKNNFITATLGVNF